MRRIIVSRLSRVEWKRNANMDRQLSQVDSSSSTNGGVVGVLEALYIYALGLSAGCCH
jgi:hypothetical protein